MSTITLKKEKNKKKKGENGSLEQVKWSVVHICCIILISKYFFVFEKKLASLKKNERPLFYFVKQTNSSIFKISFGTLHPSCFPRVIYLDLYS